MFNKLIKILIIMMLLAGAVTPVSASSNPINDLGEWISGILTGVQPLTVPIIGTVSVSCADGSTTCKYYGDNWHIQTNTLANRQNLVFTLPAGTKLINKTDNSVTTAGTTVKFTLTPNSAMQVQPVATMNRDYTTCYPFGLCFWLTKTKIPGYQVSSYAYKQVFVDTRLESARGSISKTLGPINYLNQPQFSMTDGVDIMYFRPSYMVDWGLDLGTTSLIYVDNGYGDLIAFSSASFYSALDSTELALTLYPQFGPTNWIEYLAYMKLHYGLIEYNLASKFSTGVVVKLSSNRDAVIVDYPYGTVGINGEMLIPKNMASSVTAQLDYGKPQIGTITRVPEPFTIGSNYITVTVPVTNIGSSADTFTLSLNQNIGTLTFGKRGSLIAQGSNDVYTVMIHPTTVVPQSYTFGVIVQAGGSGEIATKTITGTLIGGNPEQKQWVTVTAYMPDGVTKISTAPIKQDGAQIGTGQVRVELSYPGNYVFTTENQTIAGITYYKPTPAEVTLNGGAERFINLPFSLTPDPETDQTWIFWAILAVSLMLLAWRFGIHTMIMANPIIVIPIVIVVAAIFLFFNPDVVEAISSLSILTLYSIMLALLVVVLLAIPLPFIFFNPYIFAGTTIVLTLFFIRIMSVIIELLAKFGIK